MNRTALAFIALWPVVCRAQQIPTPVTLQPRVPDTTKLYHLNNALASHIAGIMEPLGFEIQGDNGLRAVVVRGTVDRQAQAERLISELDQPASGSSRDVELIVYVLAASEKAPAQAVAVPPAMDPVIKQLKSIFPYASYQVLDTMLVRSREGEDASTDGILRHLADSSSQRPQMYDLHYRPRVDTRSETRHLIHLDNLQFRGFLSDGQKASINTNVDLVEGQKVVVGKSNIEDGSAALFLVVSARTLGVEGESASK